MENNLSYRERANSSIRDLILEYECQPILFVGNGLSIRYIGTPSWGEMLRDIFSLLPRTSHGFDYYFQKCSGDMIEVGSFLSDLIFEWAWGDGKSSFPQHYFTHETPKDQFLKYLVAERIRSVTPTAINESHALWDEISRLSLTKPHAIITTNYDLFLEEVFRGYFTVTGQTILRYNMNSFGEVYHIHGDVSDESSLILTRADYGDWDTRKKYISAKLLTYFAEHPVFILGYGMNDPNVKSILRDIGEIVADSNGLIRNVYQIFWHKNLDAKMQADQATFSVDGKEYRINAVHTSDLKWVYDALASQSSLSSIDVKLVRALAARTMRLVRHDIPTGSVAVNYEILEKISKDSEKLPTLLGISAVENLNQTHPLTITQVARRLGFAHWNPVNQIIARIKEDTGIDIKASDNSYHCKIKTGSKANSATRKYSNAAVDLFQRVTSNAPYEVQL